MMQAPALAGIFYGMQTLRQLLPVEIFGEVATEDIRWALPFVEINDIPRFKWRGLHLDVARHFQPVEFVKKYIDLISVHKMNRFHLHLTDDQGWRIEIKKYPKLAEISAWRDETLVGHYRDEPRRFDGRSHGGFYTHDEIREMVSYAEQRFVTIVPEIEMPGHASAAIAAYPWLGTIGELEEVPVVFGKLPDSYNAADPRVYEFIENVLSEVRLVFLTYNLGRIARILGVRELVKRLKDSLSLIFSNNRNPLSRFQWKSQNIGKQESAYNDLIWIQMVIFRKYAVN